MKVLWCTPTFWPEPSGPAVLGAELALALHGRGHEIVVVAERESRQVAEEDRLEGVPVVRVAMHAAVASRDPGRIEKVWTEARRVAEALRPDLIHVHSPAPIALLALRAKARFGVPLLVTKHEMLWPSASAGPETLVGRVLREAARIACCSQSVLDELRAREPDLAERLFLVRNALPEPPVSAGEPVAPPLLVSVGRLVAGKGHDVAIELTARLRRAGRPVRLAIAGSGPEEERLRLLARETGIAADVDLMGPLPREGVRALLAASSVVLMPSASEGLPLVAIEAAQAGRPVVAFGVGGVAEVVRDGETGFVVPPGDVDALAAKVFELIDNPGSAARFGRLAHDLIRREFSWEPFVHAYDLCYRQVLDARTGERDS